MPIYTLVVSSSLTGKSIVSKVVSPDTEFTKTLGDTFNEFSFTVVDEKGNLIAYKPEN